MQGFLSEGKRLDSQALWGPDLLNTNGPTCYYACIPFRVFTAWSEVALTAGPQAKSRTTDHTSSPLRLTVHAMTPDPEIRVERLKESDLDDVLFVERSSFATPWTCEMFLSEIGNKSSYSVVFRKGTRLIGYLCVWEVLDEAHVLDLCVHPDSRGQGFGRMIMLHLEKICAAHSILRIILEVGRRNRVARNLYQSCGFLTIGFRKGYYQDINDDALVMEKRLDPRLVPESQGKE